MNSKLRKKVMEDLQLRGYADRTQSSYTRSVKQLENYWHLPAEEIRRRRGQVWILDIGGDNASSQLRHERKSLAGSARVNLPDIGNTVEMPRPPFQALEEQARRLRHIEKTAPSACPAIAFGDGGRRCPTFKF